MKKNAEQLKPSVFTPDRSTMITLWIAALETVGIAAHILKVLFSFPAEKVFCL